MKKIIFLMILAAMKVHALEGSAQYTVPVPERLEDYATFEIPAPEVVNQVDGSILVSYQLPAELVGEEFPSIQATGASYGGNTFELAGEHADVSCVKTEDKTDCQMKFKNLVIDKDAVKRAILKKSSSSFETRSRMEVARLFSSDPVGVLNY